MFKEFMKEVAAIEAAGVFNEPEIVGKAKAAEGEEVVGCIADDHYLMALCIASENRVKAFRGKTSKMMEEERQRVFVEISTLTNIMWAEIRLRFGIFGCTAGLRKGWTVVRVKEDEEDEQPMPDWF